jgi:hypothetical protein
MKSFNGFFLLVILSGVFFSCKKSSVGPGGTYHAIGLTEESGVRLFTNGKEITDKVIITKYIAGDSEFNLVYNASDYAAITFTSADTATFGNPLEKFFVKRSNNLYLFYSPYYSPVPNIANYPVITAYNGPTIQQPAGSNFSQLATEGIYVAHINSGSFALSVLAYKISLASGYIAQGVALNDFNENVKLGLKDTLAIRQYAVTYK